MRGRPGIGVAGWPVWAGFVLGVIIRQIAALPYRSSGPALDSPVSVLLVTTRETKRWVIPKGNLANGVAPHLGAAEEALEEAGVEGAVCPVPLGTFRYRKRKGSGASLMADVEVFPLAVNRELDDWPEKTERERRWFSLADAAAVVDEPDLADLIRSFGASEFNKAAQRTGMLSVVAEKSKVGPMFAWFQRLLPKTGGFFELFEAHAVALLAAADATGRLFQGGPKCHEHIREIREREHDADEIVREVLKTIRHTFLTPFDRGAITCADRVDGRCDRRNAVGCFGGRCVRTDGVSTRRCATWRQSRSTRPGWSPKRCR